MNSNREALGGLAMLVVVLLFGTAVRANAEEPKTTAAVASETRSVANVASLMTRNLTGIDGKEAIMLTVEYPPGGSSPPHRHDAHVFVYVLEGSMVMQVDGSDPVTLKAGETFYESPQDVHRQSANGSATERAKILVLMVKDQGKPASRGVGAEGAPRDGNYTDISSVDRPDVLQPLKARVAKKRTAPAASAAPPTASCGAVPPAMIASEMTIATEGMTGPSGTT